MSWSSPYSAVDRVATNLNATFSLSASNINGMTADKQAIVISGALKQSMQGLGRATEAREELGRQLGPNITNTPASGKGAGPTSATSLAASAAVAATLTAINPVLGGLYTAVEAIQSGMRGPATDHLGTQHAAINGGKSYFDSPISRKDADKKTGGYTDVLGDTWGDDGFKVAASATSAPAATGPTPNMALSRRAGRAIDQLGEQEVADQLANASVKEKDLVKQAGTAAQWAENLYGITGGDMKPDMRRAMSPDTPNLGIKPPAPTPLGGMGLG